MSPCVDEPYTPAVQAAMMVERVVGNGWAADDAGTFVYMTPIVLKRLGVTLDDLNASTADDLLGWKRIVHPDDYPAARLRWLHCLETGEHFEVETRIRKDSGAYVWSRNSGQVLRNEQGRTIGWYGTFIDSDDPVLARERYIADASGDPPKPIIPSDNQSFNRTHPLDRTSTAHAAARAFWTGVPQVTRHRQRQDDGSYRWTETRAEPHYRVSIDIDDVITTDGPQNEAVTSFMTPIDGDADPLRSAGVIESLFGNGWAFDAAGRWIYLHPFAQSSLGVTLDELNAPILDGHTAWKCLLHPNDYNDVAASWRHSLRTGEQFNVEFRFRRANGRYVWARTSARPTFNDKGDITGWYGIALDIDVHKKAVTALREKENELSKLIDMVPSHLWRLRPNGDPSHFNKPMQDFFGFEDIDFTKPTREWFEKIIEAAHPADRDLLRTTLEQSLVTGDAFSLHNRLRRSDGVYRWMSTRADPLRDETGAIVQWYGICHDIEDQMQVEENLRRSEQELRALLDALPINILGFDTAGKMTYASKRYLENVGAPLPHVDDFDRLAADLSHPDDFPIMFKRAREGMSSGMPFVNRFRRRDREGVYRWIEARAQPLRNSDGEIIQWYIISIDIEDEIRAQDELRIAHQELSRQSQAASLAELSASIAHEVNQPLAAIVANSHACQRWLAAVPPNYERARITVDRIIRDANSAADVVSRIRALFKQSADVRAKANIGDVLSQARDLIMEEALRRHVRMETEVEEGLPLVCLDSVQIQQVLVNLIRNGIEAMEETAPSERVLTLRATSSDGTVRVEVRDHGSGIASPHQIFEPFFSTKEHGMGMGLAICRSIIESHGGRLYTERNVPQGTAFIFTVPIR
jgi:PAS domain S-box-containing protein